MSLLKFAPIAAGIFIASGFITWLRLRKRIGNQFLDQQYEEAANLTAPFRSADDYLTATQSLHENSRIQPQGHQANRTIISAFSGSTQYTWDGEYLSQFGGKKIVRFDGKHVSSFAGANKYIWNNHTLSAFAGPALFKVSNGTISAFSGPKLYRFDQSSISVFAGQKKYSLKGSIAVPDAIIIVIAADLV